jgi:hypothetical protein
MKISILSLAFVAASWQSGILPFALKGAVSGPSGSLLTVSNFSCTGAFLTPGVGQQAAGGNYPLAMRYNGGNRQYFVMDGVTEHIISFTEPSLSSCATAFGSMTRATVDSVPSSGDWGAFTFGAGNSAGGDAVPGFNAGGLVGSHFDGSGNLVLGWSGNYSAVGNHNSFASAALNNGSHTLSMNGCWGLSGLTQPYVGASAITLPSAWVATNLPAGRTLGVMGGWPFATVGAGISEGPTLYAITPPSNNPCTASTDTLVGSGTTLLQYSANPGGGPACTNDVVFYGMGCTPPITTISVPYPKQIAYTTVSRETYSSDWEPYPVGASTHAWVAFLTFGAFDWYDDGTKHGIVTVLATPEGWFQETVSSSTSATSFVLSGNGTHDGLNANVGDIMWAQTCTPGTDPGCSGDQSHLETEFQISTINTSTHAITATIISQDQSSGNHFPVPGGPATFGCRYLFGTPTCSRWILRMQIDDPDDLALVAAGSKQPYAVVASNDQEIDQTLITGAGSPTAGTGAHFNNQQQPGISSVIADTTNHNLIVVLPYTQNPPFLISDAVYVLHITEPMPTPLDLLRPMFERMFAAPKPLLSLIAGPR